MTLIWIVIGVLAAAAALVLLRKPSPPVPARAVPRPQPIAPAATPSRPETAAAPVAIRPVAPMPLPVPAALENFQLLRAADLPEERRMAYLSTFHEIPRPPKLLDHLLSSGFVNTASSAQLVDLITAEPLIAARILSTVNSPRYGLLSPVGSLGQAVTYLGLNTVRSLCLQYILVASFKPDSTERKAALDTAWTASALASELAWELAQRLGLEDRGALVGAVVLSFLGRLATIASIPAARLGAIAGHGLLRRTIAEQTLLGLGSTEIGRLLMGQWGLPPDIVADAADIDSVLVKPAGAFDVERGSRLAICYVAARLGERLAVGELRDLMRFDPEADGDAEWFHLRGYLAAPKLGRLLQAVRSPEVDVAVQQILLAPQR